MRNCMKIITVIFFLVFCKASFSQDLSVYHDTTYKFSIGIPKDWKHQKISDDKTSIKLNVVREQNKETDTPRETYNVNILAFPNSNIDLAYLTMLQSISKREGYKMISEGVTTIDNKKYKWLIEQHTNIKTKESMTAYVYLGYNDNLAYMVTFATVTPAFKTYESLFRQISSTFRL